MGNIFDAFVDKYDSWYDSSDGRLLYESELLCLKPLVEKKHPPILEIGVGTGRFAMHFPDAVGVDPALNMLKKAKMRGIKAVQAYGESLPFKDETFLCVLLIATLCFVENPIYVLREAGRVLRQDGSIIIGLIPEDSPWGEIYEQKKREGHPFFSNAKFYTLEGVREMLQAPDLTIVAVRSTLLQRPDEPRRVEMAAEGYVKGSGFLCVEARKSIKLR